MGSQLENCRDPGSGAVADRKMVSEPEDASKPGVLLVMEYLKRPRLAS